MDEFERNIFDTIYSLMQDIKLHNIELDKKQSCVTKKIDNAIYVDFGKPKLDNLIKQENTIFKATEKTIKEKDKMPPKYSDGSFRERKNGTLEYRFMLNEIQKSIYGHSKQECWDKRTTLISGKTKNKSVNHYTFGEWLTKWYSTYKIRKDGSKINPNNEKYINQINKMQIASKPLNKLQGVELQELLKIYDDRTNTREKIYTCLNEALNCAVNNQIIKFNVLKAVKIEKHKRKHYNVIQPAEQNILLKEIKTPKYLLLFWICCCTGQRISEAVNSLPYIDYDKCIFNVVDEDTTTKKHQRQIPFLPQLIPKNQRHLLKQITTAAAQSYFKRLFKKLNFNFVVHSFRHTFASCSHHVGFKDKQIQKWMCHSSIVMTMDTYVDLLENENSPILDYFRELKEYLNL